MPLPTSAFTIVSYVGGPALLTNATALLLLSTSNRFGRAVDRSRALVAYLEKPEGRRLVSNAALELGMAQKRVQLLVQALSRFYLAAGMFVMATMLSIAGAVLGEYAGGFALQALITLAAVCGLFGFATLVWGSVSLTLESRLAARSLEIEAKEAMDAIEKALHPEP
jgi:hypothetical protein